jgi:hypothetical protein
MKRKEKAKLVVDKQSVLPTPDKCFLADHPKKFGR